MAVDLNAKLPAGEVVSLLSSFLFIFFPAFLLFREGAIFIFGENPLVNLHVYSAVGGAICGIGLAKSSKVLGLICGVIASLGGTALFSYYAFYPPVKETMLTSEIMVSIFIGAIPGVASYYLIYPYKKQVFKCKKHLTKLS